MMYSVHKVQLSCYKCYYIVGSTDDSNNIESSMNTDFIPELDHEDFMLQQQHDLGSPDVVSLREGLSTSDRPTLSPYLFRYACYMYIR